MVKSSLVSIGSETES